MTDDEAREYLDIVRRVISRNGLSALDTDVFSSLFSVDDRGEVMVESPTVNLRNYLDRVENYFEHLSSTRFQDELTTFNQLSGETIRRLDLVLDQQLMNQVGQLEGRQSLGGLLERFDSDVILDTVRRIQLHIWGVSDDKPPPSTPQQPRGI